MTKKTPPAHKVLLAAIIAFAVLCLGVLGLMFFMDDHGEIIFQDSSLTQGVTIVPTLRDSLTSDSAWCGTAQLVWNDLKTEYVKQDIVFTPQEPIAANLNLGEFTQEMLSEDYYYKTYGPMSVALRDEIKQAIKTKFNQSSDILDQFSWPEQPSNNRVFLYAMLYRKFEYLAKLNKLGRANFGNYPNVAFFGLKRSDDEVRNQFEVLYYRSPEDFAIILNTKTSDEVIFHRGASGNNFSSIYQNMQKQAQDYTDATRLQDFDEFKAPNLTFNVQREYTELAGKTFVVKDQGNFEAKIEKAVQSIKFSLDEVGGEVKSEFGMGVATLSLPPPPRYFNVDDEFVLFLRQKGQPLPYLAVRVTDITKFQ